MIEDEERVAGAGELLLYDYFKHLTSLCLFTLGGVVAMVDRVDAKSRFGLMLVLIVIGLGALSSFGGAAEIVRSRLKGDKPNYLSFYRVAAPILLSIGVGMFLYHFQKTLGA
jgi:hypothetical protein